MMQQKKKGKSNTLTRTREMTLTLGNSYATLAKNTDETTKADGSITNSSNPEDKQASLGHNIGKGGGTPLLNG